jgi:NADPH-dependent 2,4-dienoyl-CoA reductase/sulfur reductase-like enzyme
MYNYSGIQMVKPARRAVVVGGGFIGLEMTENLIHLGFDVTLVEILESGPGPDRSGIGAPRGGPPGTQ